ncbi:hypothetical protein FLB_09670 [Flavobacterium succinicans]|uniref:Uncharacterized protein n=1 Tax=Flavobacterium succinicans TaxID=29536 RepID=A0A199XV47_9FLAO|nr:hypothetical protein FLB_09670 [Flavobacterium succinicans]
MINLVYCSFFILFNILLFLVIDKKKLLNKSILIGGWAFFLTLIVIHFANLKLPYFMNSSDFIEIFFFSLALVFFYYLFKFLTYRIDPKKKYNQLNYLIIKSLKNGLLFKLVFSMVTLYQTLAILSH